MFKIIVVDDEAIETEALRRVIEGRYRDGCRVETAFSGQTAIALAESMRADIVLMDIEMPGMNGLAAARIIKQALPRCRVIILTAYERFQYAQEAVAIGAEEYLLKPVGDADLIAQIDRAMDGIRRDRTDEARRGALDQLAKEQFVLSAVSGYAGAAALSAQLSELGIHCACALFIAVRGAPGAAHISAEAAHKRLRPQMDALPDITWLCLEYDERLLIVALMDRGFLSAEETAGVFAGWFAQSSGTPLHAGLGSVVTDLSDLQDSYDQAMEALLSCQDTSPVALPPERPADQRRGKGLERRLYQYLLEKDFDGAARCAETALDALFYSQPHSAGRAMHRLLESVAGLMEADARIDVDLKETLAPLTAGRPTQQEMLITIRGVLAAWLSDLNDQPAARLHQVRREIERYINARYQEDLSIRQIARDMHYSEPYFSKLFTRCFQCNFVSYLTDVRLKNARDMLISPILSIKEISAAVGYADSNYFSKVFRKAYGVSPTDFRRLSGPRADEEAPV